MRKEKQESVIRYKLLYTIGILGIYLVGRELPLYGIDLAAYQDAAVDAQSIFEQTISGDLTKTSVFALGFSPYMISSIFAQLFMAIRSSDKKAKLSPKKVNYVTLFFMMLIAIMQAVSRCNSLIYRVQEEFLIFTKMISVMEMIAGTLIIMWLCDRNQKYGIGGRTAIIYVNILDGFTAMLVKSRDWEKLKIPVLIAVLVMFIVLVMENTEKRIPLQRISIHNIHADKNYLAIKLNPIGIMPIMFSTAVFMLPQLVISFLQMLFPDNGNLMWWKENMVLTRPLGIGAYIFILYFLTITFAMIMINPRNLTEQFLKSGDSIKDIHAGKDTKKYLTGSVIRISIFSSTIMSICAGLPMLLQLSGEIDSDLAMLPTSVMMLVGIWCNLYQEYNALKKYDSYKPFI